MPDPQVYRINQTIPTCFATILGGSSLDETDLDRKLTMEVHANCCRLYSTAVRLSNPLYDTTGRPLTAGLPPGAQELIYEGTLDVCSHSGVGPKVFTSPAFTLCATQQSGTTFELRLPDDPSPGLGDPWEECEIFLYIDGGLLSGQENLAAIGVNIATGMNTVAADFQSYLNGIVGSSWVDVDYVQTSPSSGRKLVFRFASNPPTEFTNGGSIVYNTGDSAGMTLAGPIAGGTVATTVYWHLEWRSCKVYGTGHGIVAEMRLVSDDSVIAVYKNLVWAVKNGTRAILNREEVMCSNPCKAVNTPAVFGSHTPQILCFQAIFNVNRCLGGLLPQEFNATLGTTSDPWFSIVSGASVNVVTSRTSAFGIFTNDGTLAVDDTFEFTGRLVVGGVTSQVFTGVTLNLTIDEELAFSGSFQAAPCASRPGVLTPGSKPWALHNVSWNRIGGVTFGTTAEMSGGGLPTDFQGPFVLTGLSLGGGATLQGTADKLWCASETDNLSIVGPKAFTISFSAVSGLLSFQFFPDDDTMPAMPTEATFTVTNPNYRP